MSPKHNLFFFLLPVVFFLSHGHLIAQKQVMDLTGVDFTKPGLHPIAGRWQFYWNRLLIPPDFKNQPGGELMEVPGSWNRQSQHPALGYATYRIKLKLPAGAAGLSIYFPVINCAAKIWVNGDAITETGKVSSDEKRYVPKLAGTIVSIPANQSELDLIVNVVNYTFFSGGFSGIPQIGKTSELLAQLNERQGIENFFAGSLIAMFIYQLVLYSLYQRGKPYLWLSLICLGVALRALVVHGGSFLLPNLFSSVPWEIWKKIEFVSVYAIIAFFPLYIVNLFSNHAPKWPVKFFIIISFTLCITVLLTPQYVYGRLLEIGHLALLLTFIYATYSIRKAWKSGNDDARTIFFGVAVSFPFIMTEIVRNSWLYSLNIQFRYLVEIGVLMFLLFQIYLLANHYAKAYKNLEYLNNNLEKMVAERTAQLMTANRVRDKLLSVVTHDIKSPLNSLRGILNIYNNGSIDELQFRHFSKRIANDLTKTGLLVDNILYWTANQLNGNQIKFERFDLSEPLKENIELFQTIALDKNVLIKNEVSESHCIHFDRNVLNLTLRNLLSNAIKFSQENDRITIRCERTCDSTLISVIDNGVGMSKDVLTMLQESKTIKSENGTRNEKGTGLGLSFCREYLRMAGGELTIQSTFGKGSAFVITIPNHIEGEKERMNDDEGF